MMAQRFNFPLCLYSKNKVQSATCESDDSLADNQQESHLVEYYP